jgi:acyl-CoA reductase-like NAD-dependent aldehyde dehydrogenase
MPSRSAPKWSSAASGIKGGTFFESTVPTDVTTDMVTTKEETFGPVGPLYRLRTEAAAIEMANDTPSLTPYRVQHASCRPLNRSPVALASLDQTFR